MVLIGLPLWDDGRLQHCQPNTQDIAAMQPQNQNRVQVYSSGLHERMRRDDTDNSSLAYVTTGVDLQ